MAKISKDLYDKDSNISRSDNWVGSDAESNKRTKKYYVGDVSDFIKAEIEDENLADVLRDADTVSPVTDVNKVITEADVGDFGGGDVTQAGDNSFTGANDFALPVRLNNATLLLGQSGATLNLVRELKFPLNDSTVFLPANRDGTLALTNDFKTINGESLIGTTDIVIDGSGGDVTLAGNNTFTGINSFQNGVDFENSVTIESFDLALNGNKIKNLGDGTLSADAVNKGQLDEKQDKLSEGAFIDGDKTKLDGITAGAKPDQDISGIGINASAITSKQDTLVSTTNIKTINGTTILGSGDLIVSGGATGSDVAYDVITWDANTDVPTKNVISDLYENKTFKVDTDGTLVPIVPIYWQGTQAEFTTKFGATAPDNYFTVVTDANPPVTSASDIVNVPSGNLVATDVQGALDELQTEVDGLSGGDVTQAGDNYFQGANYFQGIVEIDNGSEGVNAGLGMSGHKIQYLADGVIASDAVNKGQLDEKQDDLDVVSQVDAEAGTSTAERIWTAERVKQAIVALGGSGSVDDTAYGISWDGVTTVAPSKNALYDFIENQVFKVDVNSNIIPIFWGGTQAQHDAYFNITDFPTGVPDNYFTVVTDANPPAIEGTDIASTGEVGGTKFLRENGDGTSSWQTIAGGTSIYDNDGTIGTGVTRLVTVDGALNFSNGSDSAITFNDTAGSIAIISPEPIIQSADSLLNLKAGQAVNLTGLEGIDIKIGVAGIVTPPSIGQVLAAKDVSGGLEWVDTPISTVDFDPVGTDNSTDVTLTTTGTSGAATLVGQVLNIPNYAGGVPPATIAEDIINIPSGNLVATDVQGALDELQTELDAVSGGSLAVTTGTGTAIDLTNVVGAYYNIGASSTATAFTVPTVAVGGFAVVESASTTTEPTITVTGGTATEIPSLSWVVSTTMYLNIYSYDGVNVFYYWSDTVSSIDGFTASTISNASANAGLLGTEEVIINTSGVLEKTTTQDIANLGSGDVTKVGTAFENQVAIWKTDGSIEGLGGLTFDDVTTNALNVGLGADNQGNIKIGGNSMLSSNDTSVSSLFNGSLIKTGTDLAFTGNITSAGTINGATITSGTLNGSVTGTNTGDNAVNTLYSGLVSATTANVKAINDRVLEPTVVAGAYAIDYSLAETWFLAITEATALTELNLPSAGESKVITIHISGNFALTYPAGWDTNITGAYAAGTGLTTITVEYVATAVPFYKVLIVQ